MENKSNPRAKEDQRTIAETSVPPISIQDSVEESFLFLKLETLPLTEANLYQISKFCRNFSRRSLSKKTDQIEKKTETLFKRKLREEAKLKSSFSIKENIFLELKEAFNESNTINQLPKLLIDLPFFKQYQSCQILIHEKGKQSSTNINYTRLQQKREKIIPVKNFNALFNLIKKSKNKNFNQSQILKEDLDVLGNFLAKEYSLRDYNIIFILSRNDFLPIQHDDQIQFNEFSVLLKSIFEYILKRDSYNIKTNLIRRALNEIKIPCAIISASHNIVFRNKSFQNDYLSTPDLLAEIPLVAGHLLLIYKDHNLYNEADVRHFQRISLLGELLNTLQHELNNPLFGLDLSAGILKSEFSGDVSDFLGEISNNSKRCQKIIKNFANLYQGDQSYSNFNILNLFNETLTLTKSETKQIRKEIYIDPILESSPIVLSSNPTWITQIIFNLLINAAQAIKAHTELHNGLIKISLKSDKNHIVFTIHDNGPGIKEEHHHRIFDPFFTTKQKGTGLGLSICKSLSKKLGCSISFLGNNESGGASFEFKIPRGGKLQ